MFKKYESIDSNPEAIHADNGYPEPAPAPAQAAPQPSMSHAPKSGPQATIGPSIVINGELSGAEDLLIQGRVEGSIQLKQKNLTIGKDGYVKADLTAKVITVEGEVDGDLHGDEGIIVRQSGKVHGNIVSPRVNLEDGSNFKGSIDMEPASSSQKSGASLKSEKSGSADVAASNEGKKAPHASSNSNAQVQALK